MSKSLSCVVGESIAVEFILEVLKCKSIVEDVTVGNFGSCLTDCFEAVGLLVCSTGASSSFKTTYLLKLGAGAAETTAAKAAIDRVTFMMLIDMFL